MADELKKLYFEPSSRCNLECTMCFRNSWIDERISDMRTEVFEKALDTAPKSVQTVFFGGMGEPLVHKDILYMVRRASSGGARVEMLTNGTLLTRQISSDLIDAGLDMLWISIDSIDADDYDKIRQKSSFKLVRSNILAFNAERRKRDNAAEWIRANKSTELGVAFVAMKSNVSQLGKLVNFAFDNNASDINVTNVSPTDEASLDECLCQRVISLGLGADGSGHPRISLPVMDNRIDAVKSGMTDLYGTEFNLALVSGEMVARRRRYCKFVGEGAAFVRHDGDVSPCMALLHSSSTYFAGKKRIIWHHSFGNAGRQSLCDIWNSGEYASFRKRNRDFEFSPCAQCGGCEYRDENVTDCFGNSKPTCGACLWSEGVLSCP